MLRGDYERTLDLYLKHFESRQILVCFYDAIQRDPVGLMSSITGFLNVEPFDRASIDNEVHVNRSPARRIPEDARNYLVETYAPVISRLKEAFGSYTRIWEQATSPCGAESHDKNMNFCLLPAVHP